MASQGPVGSAAELLPLSLARLGIVVHTSSWPPAWHGRRESRDGLEAVAAAIR